MVVSIDAKRTPTGYEVYIDRGREATGRTPQDWALEAVRKGAGEIFLTSIDNDGSREGYDIELIESVTSVVSVPVVASGGVGDWKHFVEGIVEGGADAVSAANIFHYSEQSTKKAKDFMKAAGINVREPEFYKIKIPRRPVYRV